MTYVWRGPFSVKRDGRATWKIVNAAGDTERIGFNSKSAADEAARVMNRSACRWDKDEAAQ